MYLLNILKFECKTIVDKLNRYLNVDIDFLFRCLKNWGQMWKKWVRFDCGNLEMFLFIINRYCS